MTQKDYYEILGVEKDAGPGEIKAAYRRLAFQYHPDRNKGDGRAVEKMKELNEAYAVLSDPEKRRRYDSMREEYGSYAYDRFRQRYSEQDLFRGSDINKILEEMARNFGFRHFDEVFREFYGQGFQTFEFSRPGVFGKGFIFFGPMRGNRHQQRVSSQPGILPKLLGMLAGYFLKKASGIPAGTQETDRHDVITIDPDDARRGAKVSYIDRKTSRQIIITVPQGIKEGQTIRLKGTVMNSGYGARPGDLYLKVRFRKGIILMLKEFFKI
ncbi:MAG: Chaperone protein DnaJ [Syntrophorhabdus sp. PtaU1.Bin058]|nr:MAG: Chaperone protein DnaJ [Syntrophorhabdus sp. PtaU1.Bin058]